jgi:hypothetical protein
METHGEYDLAVNTVQFGEFIRHVLIQLVGLDQYFRENVLVA